MDPTFLRYKKENSLWGHGGQITFDLKIHPHGISIGGSTDNSETIRKV